MLRCITLLRCVKAGLKEIHARKAAPRESGSSSTANCPGYPSRWRFPPRLAEPVAASPQGEVEQEAQILSCADRRRFRRKEAQEEVDSCSRSCSAHARSQASHVRRRVSRHAGRPRSSTRCSRAVCEKKPTSHEEQHGPLSTPQETQAQPAPPEAARQEGRRRHGPPPTPPELAPQACARQPAPAPPPPRGRDEPQAPSPARPPPRARQPAPSASSTRPPEPAPRAVAGAQGTSSPR